MDTTPINEKLPLLAVFWYTEVGLIGESQPLNGIDVEDSGRFLELNITHFNLWSKFEQLFGTDDMYYYPRGRIIFDKQTNTPKVICDPKLARSPKCRKEIKLAFNLSDNTIYDTDLHYRSEFNIPIFAEYTVDELKDPLEDE